LRVEAGRFVAVEAYETSPPRGTEVVEAGDAVVLPGLVDPHVHMNDPGRADWEGFETATRAAASGGVTTLVDMPLNSLPPTTTVEALDAKREATRGRLWCDVAFWGGAVPGAEGELAALAAAGACGAKAFLADSGVPEFPRLEAPDLGTALEACGRLGVPLLVHAESQSLLDRARPPEGADARSYATWLAARPAAAEVEAVRLLGRLLAELAARGVRARAHVVHLSAAQALSEVAAARRAGLPLSAETCPHYLCLEAEQVADGATLFKCAPPIREAANRDALWEALAKGVISLVASDHSPSPPALKLLERGDFLGAWGGIASLGLGLSLVWTEASRRGHTLADLARWMSREPARLAGLEDQKGALEVGRDADFVLFDPGATWTVTPERLWTRHHVTPYGGRAVRGQVRACYLRGRRVYQDGRFDGAPAGACLSRREGGA
jgi:allantoinase